MCKTTFLYIHTLNKVYDLLVITNLAQLLLILIACQKALSFGILACNEPILTPCISSATLMIGITSDPSRLNNSTYI